MKYIFKKATGVLAFCSAFAATSMVCFAATIHTADASLTGPGTEPVQFLVTVVGESAMINTDTVSGQLLMEADTNESFPLVEETEDGWLKVQVGSEEGYLQAGEEVELQQAEEEELSAASETARSQSGRSQGTAGSRRRSQPQTARRELRHAVFRMPVPLRRH